MRNPHLKRFASDSDIKDSETTTSWHDVVYKVVLISGALTTSRLDPVFDAMSLHNFYIFLYIRN